MQTSRRGSTSSESRFTTRRRERSGRGRRSAAEAGVVLGGGTSSRPRGAPRPGAPWGVPALVSRPLTRLPGPLLSPRPSASGRAALPAPAGGASAAALPPLPASAPRRVPAAPLAPGPSGVGRMEPGGAGDPRPAPPRALARVLQRLAGPDGGRALCELGALLDGADGARLCEDPALLGRVAGALARAAAPPAGSARAEAVGALFLRLLDATGAAGRARVAGAAYVFAVSHADDGGGPGAARDVARRVLARLLSAAGAASVPGLLVGEGDGDPGTLPAVLALLQPELGRESWKKNPATKHVFSWTLQQVTRPWLGQYLEKVLPPALLISDDYQTENKILGVQCLHHILLNVPAAELLQYNRAQVVYHALFNHLYTPEHQLIEVVLPCLLDLFPILEKGQHWKGGPARPTTHCDEVLQLVLTHMEPEHRLILRRTYARSLPAFVKRLGILTVRHLKRLERVIIGYLEVYDGPEEEARLKMLETLKLLMQCTWPRIPCRTVVLLKALLKLICDVARDPDLTPKPVKNALLEAATDCLIVLDHCSKGQVKGLLAKIVQSCDDDTVVSCIRKVQVSDGTPDSRT
ncbi:TELO2-interacting protein 2 [Sorex fumeus]|uniref:TELO2-interacting protein 2 n=1 Tax=Sorex fumeus TaxID=62283 RepID=UPI0024AD306D|nr:TELO2-interacting protein 2 [Sorex fumeus]